MRQVTHEHAGFCTAEEFVSGGAYEGGNTPILHRDSFGTDVVELQELLVKKGFAL